MASHEPEYPILQPPLAPRDIVVNIIYHPDKTDWLSKLEHYEKLRRVREDLRDLGLPSPKGSNFIFLMDKNLVTFWWNDVDGNGPLHRNVRDRIYPWDYDLDEYQWEAKQDLDIVSLTCLERPPGTVGLPKESDAESSPKKRLNSEAGNHYPQTNSVVVAGPSSIGVPMAKRQRLSQKLDGEDAGQSAPPSSNITTINQAIHNTQAVHNPQAIHNPQPTAAFRQPSLDINSSTIKNVSPSLPSTSFAPGILPQNPSFSAQVTQVEMEHKQTSAASHAGKQDNLVTNPPIASTGGEGSSDSPAANESSHVEKDDKGSESDIETLRIKLQEAREQLNAACEREEKFSQKLKDWKEVTESKVEELVRRRVESETRSLSFQAELQTAKESAKLSLEETIQKHDSEINVLRVQLQEARTRESLLVETVQKRDSEVEVMRVQLQEAQKRASLLEEMDQNHNSEVEVLHIQLQEAQKRESLLDQVERKLQEETRQRMELEQILSDVERECREPFVVPALLKALISVSTLTTKVTQEDSS